MDGIMKPASWLTTILYKPLYVIKAMFLMIPWIISVRTSITKPRVFGFFQALRTSPPPFPTSDLKIGAAGFCWGGRYTILLAADTPSSRVVRHESQKATGLQPLIDCAFTAHPSMVSVPADIEAVTVPLSVSIGNEDMAMKGPLIQQMKEILEVKKKGDHEVVILPGAKHGFAVRTDTSDAFQMECAEKAEEQAVNWFARWFA
jgi:dienelactone hydrolase